MSKVKFVPWETVQVGDLIKATVVNKDVISSATGVVARIDDYGYLRTFYTREDVKLFSQTIDGKLKVKVELMKTAYVPHTELELGL